MMRPPFCGLKQGNPNPVVVGRRFCPACGRWRLVATDFAITSGGKVRAWCRPCQNHSNELSIARRSEEQRERIREYQRIWHEVQRRRAGVPERNFNYAPENKRRRKTVIDKPERVMLPPEPIRALLAHLDDGGQTALARRAKVSPKAISRIINAEQNHVRIDTADKITHALGLPLGLVYLNEAA